MASSRDEVRHELEQQCREIGEVIAENIPRNCGFMLMVFEYGEGGWMTYMSNAKRADMVRVLQEWIDRVNGEAEHG